MTSEALTLRDLLLPFLGAAAGYVVGVLQTAATNLRDRRRALNAVLFSLLQMRGEILTSNPRDMLAALGRYLSKRFGPEATKALADSNVRALIYQVMQDLTSARIPSLETRYQEAIKTLVPFYPLLAYRLRGDRISLLSAFSKNYYERVRQIPDIANDPNAPTALRVIEHHTADVAFAKAASQLAEDICAVASAFSVFGRSRVMSVLEEQSKPIADEEFDLEFAGQMDLLVEQIEVALQNSTSPAHGLDASLK
jgi:hypothetical protein